MGEEQRDGDRLGRLANSRRPVRYLSTEEAAEVIGGVTARWVRKQIELERLPARVLLTGCRPTYRIREDRLRVFLRTWTAELGHGSRERDTGGTLGMDSLP